MDPHAEFLSLLLAHQGELRAYLRAAVRDASLRDDLTQEIALALWRSFDRYDRTRPFGAWARGVAVKIVLKRAEAGRREAVPLSPEALAALAEAPTEEPAAASRRHEALRLCLARVPVRGRRLVQLRYAEALTLAEIAARVGGTLDAVHKALCRLRVELERCIARRLARGGEAS